MSYPEIYIPVDKNLYTLSNKEAKIFNKWYVENTEERIKVLELIVKQDKEHVFWYADFSRASIEELGEWLYNNLSARKYTKIELEESVTKNKYPDWFANIAREQSGDKVFSDETYRKCFDIGIYFGESLRKAIPSLKWTYKTSNNFVYKHQPILVKEGNKVTLSPRDIVQGIAGKFMRDEVTPNELVSIFDVWKNVFTASPSDPTKPK